MNEEINLKTIPINLNLNLNENDNETREENETKNLLLDTLNKTFHELNYESKILAIETFKTFISDTYLIDINEIDECWKLSNRCIKCHTLYGCCCDVIEKNNNREEKLKKKEYKDE